MTGSPEFHVKRADWHRDQALLRAMRCAVFVEELGIPEQLEWDGRDAAATHLIAWTEDGTAAGTVRLLPDGRIGRMAVVRAWRGRGIGTVLLQTLLELARREGFAELHLHAQVPAIAFYRRFGFRADGPVFEEAGIAHQAMRLAVQ